MVRRADMTIVDAAADMKTYPHAECTDDRAELPRPDRPVGGPGLHQRGPGALRTPARLQPLEFLARAIGPVVVQGVTSSGAWQVEKGDGQHPLREGGFAFLTNTCHVWAEDGPGPQKIAVGLAARHARVPGAPAVEIRRRMAEETGGGATGGEATNAH